MNKEDKELLYKGLCSRLPYGVKIYKALYGATTLNERDIESFRKGFDDIIIPYLRSMSSMTEEEKKEYNSLCDAVPISYYTFGYIVEDIELYDNFDSIDWLNKHHFDYHGLIERGLAIEVTEENNPY